LKFLIALFLSLILVPVFAEPLSDRTGISASFDVSVDDKVFVVKSTANFDIRSIRFDNNTMVLDIKSSLENNLGELQIPQNITKGQIKFYLDGNEIPAKILQNEKISFVTLEFQGNGTHTLEVTSDYATGELVEQSGEQVPAEGMEVDNNTMIIIAVVGIMIVAGVASTLAFYFKQKTKVA
jgi:hypothetical protein